MNWVTLDWQASTLVSLLYTNPANIAQPQIMSFDVHVIVTGLLGLVSGIIGWFSRELWAAVQELRKDIKELEVQLTRDYVRYDRLQDALRPIMETLEKIDSKLDHKVDKTDSKR